jgi:hypothetical protein
VTEDQVFGPGLPLHLVAVAGGMYLAHVVGDSPLWALLGWAYLFSFPFRL